MDSKELFVPITGDADLNLPKEKFCIKITSLHYYPKPSRQKLM